MKAKDEKNRAMQASTGTYACFKLLKRPLKKKWQKKI
jgi:hypothetical protein